MPTYDHHIRIAPDETPHGTTDDGTPILNFNSFDTWSRRNTEVTIAAPTVAVRGSFARRGDHFRLTAEEGTDPDLRLPAGYNDKLVSFTGDEGGTFEWSGVNIDQRADNATGGIRVFAPEFTISDIVYKGRGTHSDSNVSDALNLAVSDPDGLGLVKNVTAKQGSSWARYKGGNGKVWLWAGPDNVGTIRAIGCDVREFGNNGIYASASPGPIQAEKCTFINNNVAAYRAGSDGSHIKDSRIIIDQDLYTGPHEPAHERTAFYHRGIWIEAKRDAAATAGSPQIINTRTEVRGGGKDDSEPHPTGSLGIQVRPNAGGVETIDSDILVTAPQAVPVVAPRPGATGPTHKRHPKPDTDHTVRVHRTRVVNDGDTPLPLLHATGRDMELGDDCYLENRTDGAPGAVASDGRLSIGESVINVKGDPAQPTTTDLSRATLNIAYRGGSWPPDGRLADNLERPPQPEPTDTSNELLALLDPMKLEIVNHSDRKGKASYELHTTDDSTIEPGPSGDEGTDYGARGNVWPNNADTYQLTGAITHVKTSGSTGDDLHARIDGTRVPIEQLPAATFATLAIGLGETADTLIKSLSEFNE